MGFAAGFSAGFGAVQSTIEMYQKQKEREDKAKADAALAQQAQDNKDREFELKKQEREDKITQEGIKLNQDFTKNMREENANPELAMSMYNDSARKLGLKTGKFMITDAKGNRDIVELDLEGGEEQAKIISANMQEYGDNANYIKDKTGAYLYRENEMMQPQYAGFKAVSMSQYQTEGKNKTDLAKGYAQHLKDNNLTSKDLSFADYKNTIWEKDKDKNSNQFAIITNKDGQEIGRGMYTETELLGYTKEGNIVQKQFKDSAIGGKDSGGNLVEGASKGQEWVKDITTGKLVKKTNSEIIADAGKTYEKIDEKKQISQELASIQKLSNKVSLGKEKWNSDIAIENENYFINNSNAADKGRVEEFDKLVTGTEILERTKDQLFEKIQNGTYSGNQYVDFAKNVIEKYTPEKFRNQSREEQIETYQRLIQDANISAEVADYLRVMSGTAASEAEALRTLNTLVGGGLFTSPKVKAEVMDSFIKRSKAKHKSTAEKLYRTGYQYTAGKYLYGEQETKQETTFKLDANSILDKIKKKRKEQGN